MCSPQEWHGGSKQAPAVQTTRSTAAAGCLTTQGHAWHTHSKAGVLGTVHQAKGTCTHRRCQGSQRSKTSTTVATHSTHPCCYTHSRGSHAMPLSLASCPESLPLGSQQPTTLRAPAAGLRPPAPQGNVPWGRAGGPQPAASHGGAAGCAAACSGCLQPCCDAKQKQ